MIKRLFCITILVTLSVIPCNGQEKQAAGNPNSFAFINVNVVPMDQERIIGNQTVVIKGERIESIGLSDDIEVPSEALIINGVGKYLMPGLVDMHVHIEHEDALALFIANGVTTVRNMWGTSAHLVWKERISQGEIVGPTIYTAGPIIDGPPGIWNSSLVLDQPERAEQLVAEQKAMGYDFIKVYYLEKEPFNALIAAASKYDMPVIGHASDDVGMEGVLASGQHTIEHLDGYWKMLEADDSPYRSNTFDYHSYLMTWNHIDEKKMPAAASLTESSGVWNCATLVVYQRNASPAEAESLYALPEMRYMDQVSRASWDPTRYFATKFMTEEEWAADHKTYPTLTKFTGYLHRAGARLLLGTDTPNPFVVPGFSIHTELQNFVKAGMSPYEAIKTGTYNAADCLAKLDKFGTVAVGKRADLILLNENPLEDVANIAHRAGVMVRGRWFSEAELQKNLEKIVASYTPPPNRFAHLPPIDSRAELVLKRQYELKYNDIPFGEERYVMYSLDNGTHELISQTVTDRPYLTKTTATMLLDSSFFCNDIEYVCETSTGNNQVRLVRSNDLLKITGTLKGGAQIKKQKPISDGEILSPPRVSVCVSSVPIIASYLQLNRHLQSMEVGDSLEIRNASFQLVLPFEISEESFIVKREADAKKQVGSSIIPIRVYSFDIASSDNSIHTTLSTDLEGQIVSLEIEQQIGILSFNRMNRE